MIKELSWYLESGRFSALAEELETSLKEYERVKKEGNEESINEKRENTRELFEDHSVRSGIREEGKSYINIDAEFFEGNTLDEKAKDTFIKNIIKGHCYQKTLWTYMGTTGAFTAISKKAMLKQGLKYENYLPLEYKKNNPVKKPLADKTQRNEELFYIYSDGSVSKNYIPEKAEVRFNRLEDKSGVDWKAGYNPNGSVKKEGWHGRFDHEGTWVRVDYREDEYLHAEERSHVLIELIKEGDTAILYDPGLFLVSCPMLMYLTEDGMPYGSLEMDSMKAVEQIRETLERMGVKEISAIGGAVNEEVLPSYRSMLKGLVSENLRIVDRKEVAEVKEAHNRKEQLKAAEEKGVKLERKLKAAGKGSSAVAAIILGRVEVPLSVRKEKDRAILGLNEKEAEEICAISVSSDNETAYDNILSNLYASWYMYEGSFENKTEAAKLVNEYLENGNGSEITAQTSLEDIINGASGRKVETAFLYTSGIPGMFFEAEIVDFYNEAQREEYAVSLEKREVLPKGGASVALEALKTLPHVDSEMKEKLNIGLTRVLCQYKAISMSTGLPISELIETVKASVLGSRDVSSVTKRKVFYEIETGVLVKEAGKENLQKKEEVLEDSLDNSAETAVETIVIGGVRGRALDEVEFTKEKLTGEYGFSEEEAEKAWPFLHSVRINNENAAILLLLGKRIKADKVTIAAGLKKSILSTLEEREKEVSYNLSASEGLQAYMESSRGRESNVSEEDIQELLEIERVKSGAVTVPSENICKIEPKYRDKGGVVTFTRSTPKGTPEKIHLAGNQKKNVSFEKDRVFPLPAVTLESNNISQRERVNIHTGYSGNEMTRHLDVLAFAYGNDIYFKDGAYRPESEEGRKLIAHELKHVEQYEEGRAHRSADVKELEREAQAAEKKEEYVSDPRVPYVIGNKEVFQLPIKEIARVEAMVKRGMEEWVKEREILLSKDEYHRLLLDYQDWLAGRSDRRLDEVKQRQQKKAVKAVKRSAIEIRFAAKDAEKAWERAVNDEEPSNAVKVSKEEGKREKVVLGHDINKQHMYSRESYLMDDNGNVYYPREFPQIVVEEQLRHVSTFKVPDGFYNQFNKDTMIGYQAIGAPSARISEISTKCNEFLPNMVKKLGNDVYSAIYPDGLISASASSASFKANPNLEQILPNGTASEKANTAQELADNGYLVLAAITDGSHVAAVGPRSLSYGSYPINAWRRIDGEDGYGAYQTGNGYGGTPGPTGVLWEYPVFVQAGSYTGIVNPGNAMTRQDFNNNKVDYYLYKPMR